MLCSLWPYPFSSFFFRYKFRFFFCRANPVPDSWIEVDYKNSDEKTGHTHMNCAPTGAGFRIHQSTWWSTINMQPLSTISQSPILVLNSQNSSSFLEPRRSRDDPTLNPDLPVWRKLPGRRFANPQRALLQVPDWHFKSQSTVPK